MLNAVRKPYLYRSSIPNKLTACTSRYRGTAVLRAGRAGFTKKSLHLTFQSVQRGTIDGDAAPPISKLLKDNIEPRAKRFPCPHCISGALSAELPSQENKLLFPNLIYMLPNLILFLKVCAPMGFGRINQMGLAVMRHAGELLPAARSRAAKSGAASAAKPIRASRDASVATEGGRASASNIWRPAWM